MCGHTYRLLFRYCPFEGIKSSAIGDISGMGINDNMSVYKLFRQYSGACNQNNPFFIYIERMQFSLLIPVS